MKIKITLFDKREIETDLTQEEYDELKQGLVDGKIKFVSIGEQIYKATFITSAEPIVGADNRQLRLKEPEFRNVNFSDGMKSLFDRMKEAGMFEGYNSYEDWEKRNSK